VDQLNEQTPIKPGDRILDIATGTAVIPRKLINGDKKPGIRIIGLDITESMLVHGKRRIPEDQFDSTINLTCGDAMSLPFIDDSFDVVVTGLATHHINIPLMFAEIMRVLKEDGILSMIDVGASSIWRFPFVKIFLRIFTFFYFLFKENIPRAWAEATAVTNVWTLDKWDSELKRLGFREVTIKSIPSQSKWIPDPFAIFAKR
jgi:ubiquinone/menaquinone biosynthesis C-methylase UbiE